jgi:4-deoxy-L-threo-5-hexosulose-uronate ketol-isomerase
LEIRDAASAEETKRMDTSKLRGNYLIESLFVQDKIQLVYTFVDRCIIGGAMPLQAEVRLEADRKDLGSDYFLERREIGIINIGGEGSVHVNGESYALKPRDCLYIGLGNREVSFTSVSAESPAKFYFISTPAHRTYPTVKADISEAAPVHLGNISQSNERTIYKFIHKEGIQSCQLVMGMTLLKPNNMWNTMPCHTHNRRSEIYFYFDMPKEGAVFHLMGQPSETRHLVVRNEQAVISPSWSIHSGVGTSNYTFIWSMAGENQTFEDMDMVDTADLK